MMETRNGVRFLAATMVVAGCGGNVDEFGREFRTERVGEWRLRTYEQGGTLSAEADYGYLRYGWSCFRNSYTGEFRTSFVLRDPVSRDLISEALDEDAIELMRKAVESTTIRGTRQVAERIAETCGWTLGEQGSPSTS